MERGQPILSVFFFFSFSTTDFNFNRDISIEWNIIIIIFFFFIVETRVIRDHQFRFFLFENFLSFRSFVLLFS